MADAVASGSLFIHGSMVDEGSVASWRATATTRRSLRVKADERKELACTTACGKVGAGLPVGASTVCDVTCAEGGRFDGYLCGAGSSIKFGAMCRLCFNDVEEARKAESRLKNGKHVIMCDTMRPPAAVDCSDECTIKKDTVRMPQHFTPLSWPCARQPPNEKSSLNKRIEKQSHHRFNGELCLSSDSWILEILT